MAAKVEIKRWKAARSRFATGPGFAWHWRYDATLPDGTELAGIERLSTITAMIKKAGAEPVRAWGEA